jgi:hypothetical protein
MPDTTFFHCPNEKNRVFTATACRTSFFAAAAESFTTGFTGTTVAFVAIPLMLLGEKGRERRDAELCADC